MDGDLQRAAPSRVDQVNDAAQSRPPSRRAVPDAVAGRAPASLGMVSIGPGRSVRTARPAAYSRRPEDLVRKDRHARSLSGLVPHCDHGTKPPVH